jgi:SAM-dependent methyltransferase
MAEITGKPDYMAKEYVEYQQRYRKNPRESDKVLITLLQKNLKDQKGKSLLDIGCHNGNLLFHIRKNLPDLRLCGGDLFPAVISQCKADADLKGIAFEEMDIRALDGPPFDVIVTSAVLARFSDVDHEVIWKNIYRKTNPGGFVISFDWYIPFHQTLKIIEETDAHPDGLILNFRSQKGMRTILDNAGFCAVEFQPFIMPINLPLTNPSDPLYTHTRLAADGERLQFRGCLYQPWHYLIAHKPA